MEEAMEAAMEAATEAAMEEDMVVATEEDMEGVKADTVTPACNLEGTNMVAAPRSEEHRIAQHNLKTLSTINSTKLCKTLFYVYLQKFSSTQVYFQM